MKALQRVGDRKVGLESFVGASTKPALPKNVLFLGVAHVLDQRIPRCRMLVGGEPNADPFGDHLHDRKKNSKMIE